MPPEKVNLLYIAGTTRSGSTILGRLLGELPDAVHVGELGLLTKERTQNDIRCECRRTVAECDFWQAVFERAFGGLDSLDLKSLQDTRNQYRLRSVPLLLLPKTPRQTQRLREYTSVLSLLYEAIREVSGASVIIDGSKDALYAYLLSQVPTLDVHVVHLLRGSRAVAFSHQRVKKDPPQISNPGQLRRAPPWQTALHWNAVNLLLNAAHNPRPTLLRYEDFVADPSGTVRRLWALTGEPLPPLDFLADSVLHLHPGHSAAGNPDRFQSEVRIKPDLEWQKKMSPADRRLVTALTFPLLLRYGYLNRSPEAEPQTSIQPSRVL